jgi:hypothetical protein
VLHWVLRRPRPANKRGDDGYALIMPGSVAWVRLRPISRATTARRSLRGERIPLSSAVWHRVEFRVSFAPRTSVSVRRCLPVPAALGLDLLGGELETPAT